jgi:plasmid stabilization system protein ParE
MAGSYKVIWSQESKKQVDLICAFIKDKWTIKEADDFLDLLMHFERTISSFPKAFKSSPKNKLYRLGLIHKHTTAVYLIKKKTVLIITVFDNRTNDAYR